LNIIVIRSPPYYGYPVIFFGHTPDISHCGI
jgi:hypothetical protein